MIQVKSSAPGKLILFGEHAVVYGTHALTCSISSMRTTVSIKVRKSTSKKGPAVYFSNTKCWGNPPLRLTSSDLSSLRKATPPPHSELSKYALAHIMGKFSPTLPPGLALDISVTGNLPIKSGLGSSASFSVATSAALAAAYGLTPCEAKKTPLAASAPPALASVPWKRLVNETAYGAECIFHTNPSGIDNSICTFGSAALYSKSGGIEPVTLGKRPKLAALIIDSGVKHSTKMAVEHVKKLHKKYPRLIEPALARVDEIALEAAFVMSHNVDYRRLNDLIDENQYILNDIFDVGHEETDKIVKIAHRNGLHPKITGGGMGGCLFALLPPSTTRRRKKALVNLFKRHGFKAFVVGLGGEGVTVKKNNRFLFF